MRTYSSSSYVCDDRLGEIQLPQLIVHVIDISSDQIKWEERVRLLCDEENMIQKKIGNCHYHSFFSSS